MESRVPVLIAQLRTIIGGLQQDTSSEAAWDVIFRGMEGLAAADLLDAEEVQSVIDELTEGGPDALKEQATNLIQEFTQRPS